MSSIKERSELFFQKLKEYGPAQCTANLPYLHILRNHFPQQMQFWFEMLGWGYGYFSSVASEHLNKSIKTLEWSSTNRDTKRFLTITRKIPTQQFYYTYTLFTENRNITSSGCQQPSHNKNNKNCLMHPSQPAIYFEDSDNEATADT